MVDGGERFHAWSVVDPFDQVACDRVGDGVDHLCEYVLGFDQLDHRGLLAGPERLPSSPQGVLVLAVELMEVFEELGQPAVVVDEQGMVVV